MDSSNINTNSLLEVKTARGARTATETKAVPVISLFGDLAGSLFQIAVPRDVNVRHFLIFCHGYRPDGIPKSASLDITRVQYQLLLRKGWLLASTSYRREGRLFLFFWST
jgi:hypothetical protein